MCLFKKRETLKMENTAELLGPAMRALGKYKEKHRDKSPVAVIHGDDVLGAEHTQTLLKHHYIYEITDSWYYEGSGVDPSDWYKAYWYFISAYLNEKYGEDWLLSSDDSLLFLSGSGVIPRQLAVRTPFPDEHITRLPFGHELLTIQASDPPIPEAFEQEPSYGLMIFPLNWALLTASPGFFRQHPVEARTCLAMVGNPGALVRTAVNRGFINGACRVAGGIRSIGNPWFADYIMSCLRNSGCTGEEENPFPEDIAVPMDEKAIRSRMMLLWRKMRPAVLDAEETILTEPRDWNAGELMNMMEEVYVKDAFHSLNIDGYVVSQDLIEKSKGATDETDTGDWGAGPMAACFAKDYARAFRYAESDIIDSLTGGDEIGKVVHSVIHWHEWQTESAIDAKLLPYDGRCISYRNGQCYVARSRHIPVGHEDVKAAMETLRELLTGERNAFVRAVLGHFLLVYIHPFMECNGIMARFLMNSQLLSGGYPWTVITEDLEEEYDYVLEKACVDLDISGFAALVARQVDLCGWSDNLGTRM